MKQIPLFLTLASLAVLCGQVACQPQQAQPNRDQAPAKVPDPVAFASKDGKVKGWKVTLPDGRSLATPAVVDGKVFVGGGFGSHEFYAFDAATGKKLWQYQTGDDGPTAAAVSDGYVAFNTESCELEILTVEGKPVWKKWLGDPLMSMPAIAGGKVYMAYPDSKGDKEHYLACFGLKDGKELWKHKIAGEIITAPVVENDKVYLICLEGSMYCFDSGAGKLVWKEKKDATSSPLVWDGRCYFSRRTEVVTKADGKEVKEQQEQVANRATDGKGEVKDLSATRRTAHYLDYARRKSSPLEKANREQDAGVGFAAAKGDAKIDQAQMNIGQGCVIGVWSYQGSRPFVSGGRMFSSMGDRIVCLDVGTEKEVWNRQVRKDDEKDKELLDGTLTPPALANDRVFVGTSYGEVRCLSAKTGELLWSVNVGEPIAFQPAVVKGRVFVATSRGTLFGLETGDDKDDGWAQWGGSASHNGPAK